MSALHRVITLAVAMVGRGRERERKNTEGDKLKDRRTGEIGRKEEKKMKVEDRGGLGEKRRKHGASLTFFPSPSLAFWRQIKQKLQSSYLHNK